MVVADNFEATDYFPSIKGGTWMFFTAAPIRDPAGNITGAIETLQDITSLRKKKRSCRQPANRCRQHSSRQRPVKRRSISSTHGLRRVSRDTGMWSKTRQNSSPGPLPDGTHVFVNEAFCRYYHKTREEIIGEKFIPDIPAEDMVLLKEHFASLTRDHPTAIITHRIILDSGEIRWQRWSNRAIFDEKGALFEYQSVGSDVTEQKRADEALRESEATLASIFRAAPVGIGLVSDRVLVKVNDRIAEMTGYSCDELRGKNARILYPGDTDYELVGTKKYQFDQETGAGTAIFIADLLGTGWSC